MASRKDTNTMPLLHAATGLWCVCMCFVLFCCCWKGSHSSAQLLRLELCCSNLTRVCAFRYSSVCKFVWCVYVGLCKNGNLYIAYSIKDVDIEFANVVRLQRAVGWIVLWWSFALVNELKRIFCFCFCFKYSLDLTLNIVGLLYRLRVGIQGSFLKTNFILASRCSWDYLLPLN